MVQREIQVREKPGKSEKGRLTVAYYIRIYTVP